MRFEYETERLVLKVLDERSAAKSKRFYEEGAEIFNRVEAKKPDNYCTTGYQRKLLRAEYKSFLAGSYMRYYFFEAANPDTIIGTCSFAEIRHAPYNSCIMGYKLLPRFQKKGYALEGISELISALFEEDRIHRIEAFTLPDNLDSISLLLRLGFEFESIARSVILLNGEYRDHNRYVMINPLHLQ